jgi:fructose-1,6-bisphosphatase/inositol monophosphatase family enzyme
VLYYEIRVSLSEMLSLLEKMVSGWLSCATDLALVASRWIDKIFWVGSKRAWDMRPLCSSIIAALETLVLGKGSNMMNILLTQLSTLS